MAESTALRAWRAAAARAAGGELIAGQPACAMQSYFDMKYRISVALIATMVATSLATGCATTSTYSTEWTADGEYSPRDGIVESVREVVRHVQGNPVGGAAAGALIGAVLFGGHGPRTLFGAAAGAATGAALSQGSYETRAYEVVVRFDNGARGVFTYRDYAPFRPGDRIVMGPDGPRRVIY